MGFTCTIPIVNMAAANAALEPTYGPENFRLPLRPPGGTGEAESVALHSIATDAAFQSACAALPGAVVYTSAPLAVAFEAHVASEGLEWTDPTDWYVLPIMTGDQRLSVDPEYPGLWESLIDFNVWPIPIGWREVVAEGYPTWVQPTGAHDAYAIGARVTFSGQDWESTVPANVWQPGVFGWVVL